MSRDCEVMEELGKRKLISVLKKILSKRSKVGSSLVSTVRPSEAPVQEWEFIQRQGIHSLVEQGTEGVVESVIVFIGRPPDQVKVTGNHPRVVRAFRDVLQRVQELSRICVHRRAVDICDGEGEVGQGGC